MNVFVPLLAVNISALLAVGSFLTSLHGPKDVVTKKRSTNPFGSLNSSSYSPSSSRAPNGSSSSLSPSQGTPSGSEGTPSRSEGTPIGQQGQSTLQGVSDPSLSRVNGPLQNHTVQTAITAETLKALMSSKYKKKDGDLIDRPGFIGELFLAKLPNSSSWLSNPILINLKEYYDLGESLCAKSREDCDLSDALLGGIVDTELVTESNPDLKDIISTSVTLKNHITSILFMFLLPGQPTITNSILGHISEQYSKLGIDTDLPSYNEFNVYLTGDTIGIIDSARDLFGKADKEGFDKLIKPIIEKCSKMRKDFIENYKSIKSLDTLLGNAQYNVVCDSSQ